MGRTSLLLAILKGSKAIVELLCGKRESDGIYLLKCFMNIFLKELGLKKDLR